MASNRTLDIQDFVIPSRPPGRGYAMTSQTVVNHCRRPVAILSVNSIIDALNESGNLGCSFVEKVVSIFFMNVV